MLAAVADTHALIWYFTDDKRLSKGAGAAFDQAAASGQEIGFSTITIAEILYLTELGRIPEIAWDRLNEVLATPASLIELQFNASVALLMPSIPRTAIPELPDRIITATALRHKVPLITRDTRIHAANAVKVIW